MQARGNNPSRETPALLRSGPRSAERGSADDSASASVLDERLAGVDFAQADGAAPEIELNAVPEGEHRVGLLRLRFHGGAFVKGAGHCHWAFIHLGDPVAMSCRIGRQRVDHVTLAGTLALCPAGLESVAESGDRRVEGVLLLIPTQPLALMCAEWARPTARLVPKLYGCDADLCSIVRDLIDETTLGFSRRSAHSAVLSDALLEHVFEHYMHDDPSIDRGVLTKGALARIHRYVDAHLDETLEVDRLADVVGQTRSNFPRVFRRTLGMSPYQYVVRRRVARALQLLRAGGRTAAEVALATGFTDQSHLTNWTRRIYGTSLTRLRHANT
jgi:AraC family transcriptional regulator